MSSRSCSSKVQVGASAALAFTFLLLCFAAPACSASSTPNAGSLAAAGASAGGAGGAVTSESGAAGLSPSTAGAAPAGGAPAAGAAGTTGGSSALGGMSGTSGSAGGGAGGQATGAAGAAGSGGSGGSLGGAGGQGGTPGMLKAVMIVQTSGTPTAGDKVMEGRLSAHGIKTTFYSDVAVTAALVAGIDLIVISSSAESGPLGKKVRDVAIPILCIENGELPLMGMTGTTLNTDYGQLANQTKVSIASAGSPLVGTLSGTLVISSVAGDFGWGIPGAAALKGAAFVNNANQFPVFGYEKGAQMVGIVAPAKRAFYGIRETLAANLTADGSKLFDAILNWVLL